METSYLSQKCECTDNSKKHGQNVESSIFVNHNVVKGKDEVLEQQKMANRSPYSCATCVHAKTGELSSAVLIQTRQQYRKSPRYMNQRRRPPRLSVEPCSAVLTQAHEPYRISPRFQRRPPRLSSKVSHLEEHGDRRKPPINESISRHQSANSEQKTCHETDNFHCRSNVFTKRERQQSSSDSYGSSKMVVSAKVDNNYCPKITSNNYKPICNTQVEDWSLDLIDLSQSDGFKEVNLKGQSCMTLRELQLPPVSSPDTGIGKSLLDSSAYPASHVEDWDLESVPVTVITRKSVPVIMNTPKGIPVMMNSGDKTPVLVNTSPEQNEDYDSKLGGHVLMTYIEAESSDLQCTPKTKLYNDFGMCAVYANNMGSAHAEHMALNNNTSSTKGSESNFGKVSYQNVSCMKQEKEDIFQKLEDWTDELIVVDSPLQLENDIEVCLPGNISEKSDILKESFRSPSSEIHPRLQVKVYKSSSVSLVTDMAGEGKLINAVEKLGAGIVSKDSNVNESNNCLASEPKYVHETELLMVEPESSHLNKPEHSVISESEEDHIHELKFLTSKSLDQECVHGSVFLKNVSSETRHIHKSEASANLALESNLLNEPHPRPKPLINTSLGLNHVHELNHLQKTSEASHMHKSKYLVKSKSDTNAVQDPKLLLNKPSEPESVGKSELLITTFESCPVHESSLPLPDSFFNCNGAKYTESEKFELYSACASQLVCGVTSSETFSSDNKAEGQLLPKNTQKIVEITTEVNLNQLESECSIHYNSYSAAVVECSEEDYHDYSEENDHILTTLSDSHYGTGLEQAKGTICNVDVESPDMCTSSESEIQDFDVDNSLPESRLEPSVLQSDYRAHKSIICSHVDSDLSCIKDTYIVPTKSSACHTQQSSCSPEDQRNKIGRNFSALKESVHYYPDVEGQALKKQLCHEKMNIKDRENLSKTLQRQKELPRDKHAHLDEKSSEYFTASCGHEEEDRMRHIHETEFNVRTIPERDYSRDTEVIVSRGRGFYKEFLANGFHSVDRHTKQDSVYIVKAAGCENVPINSTQKKEQPSVTERKLLTGAKLKNNPIGRGSIELDVEDDCQQSVLYDENLQTKLCVDVSNVAGDVIIENCTGVDMCSMLNIVNTDLAVHKPDNLRSEVVGISVSSTIINGGIDVQTPAAEEKFIAEDSNFSQEGIGRDEVSVYSRQFKVEHELDDSSERVRGCSSSDDPLFHASEIAYFSLGPSKNDYACKDIDMATSHDELCDLPYDEDSCSSEDEGQLSANNRRIFRATSQEDLTSTSVFQSFAYERGSENYVHGLHYDQKMCNAKDREEYMKSHCVLPLSSERSYQTDPSSYNFHGFDIAAQGHHDFYQRHYGTGHFPCFLSEWEHWQREQRKAHQQWYSLCRYTQNMGQHSHCLGNGTGVEAFCSSLEQMSLESELYCDKSLTEEEELNTPKGHHSQHSFRRGLAKCNCAVDEKGYVQTIPQSGDLHHAKTADFSKIYDKLKNLQLLKRGASAAISINSSNETGTEKEQKTRKCMQQNRKTHLDMISNESENLHGKTPQKTEKSGIEDGVETQPERHVRARSSEALGPCTCCREWIQYWLWRTCMFPVGTTPSLCSISNTPTTLPHSPQCLNMMASSRSRSDQGQWPFDWERSGQEQWPHDFHWNTGCPSIWYHGYKPAARSPEERTFSFHPYSCGDAWTYKGSRDPSEGHHSSSSRISSGPRHNQRMNSHTSSNMGVGHPVMNSFPVLAANPLQGQWNYMKESSQTPNIPTTISHDEKKKPNGNKASVLNLQKGANVGSSEHNCTISALNMGQMPNSKTMNFPYRVRDEFLDTELANHANEDDNRPVKSLSMIDSSLNGMISAQVVSPHWLTEQYSSPSFGSRVDNVSSAHESSISSEKKDANVGQGHIKSNYQPIKGRYICMAGDVAPQNPIRNWEELPISKGSMNGQDQNSVVEKAAPTPPFPYNYSNRRMPSRIMPYYRKDAYEGFTVVNSKDKETENSNSGYDEDNKDKARVDEDSSIEVQPMYTTWSFPPPPPPYRAALSGRGLPPSSRPGYCYHQRTSSSMNGQEMRLSSFAPCSSLPGFHPPDIQVPKPRPLESSGVSNIGDGTIFPHALGDTNEQHAKFTGCSEHLQIVTSSISEKKVTSFPASEKHHHQSIWDSSTVSLDNYQPEAEPVEHATKKLKSSHTTFVQSHSKVGDFGEELEEAETTSKTVETHVPRYIPPHKRICSMPSSSSDSSPVSTAGKIHRSPQYRKASLSLQARKAACFDAESSSISSRRDTDSDDSSEVDVSVASQESLTMPFYDPTRPPPILPPFPASPFWSTYTSSESSALLGHDQIKSFSSRPGTNSGNSFDWFSMSPVTSVKTESSKKKFSDLELIKESAGGAIKKKSFGNLRFKPRSYFMTTETDNDSLSLQSNWKTHYNTRVEGYGQTYIDSHCHLDFLFNRSGFKGTLTKYKELNKYAFPKTYEGCVAVFCNPASFNPTGGFWMDVAAEKDVWLAFGCHPKMATDFTPWAEQRLRECMQHPKAVALGEIGLDYSGTFRQHEVVQKDVFRRQLNIALEMNKPLVIHCRDAEEDCLSILKEMVPSDYKIHCHCFTGYYENAKLWMEAFPNLYIGLTPLVTYRNAVPTHNLAKFIPLSKLLLETDAPYFIPRQVPKNEVMFSHPGFAVTVAEEVAKIKEIPVDIVLNAARKNTRNMYGI